jgi:hypothetical protein
LGLRHSVTKRASSNTLRLPLPRRGDDFPCAIRTPAWWEAVTTCRRIAPSWATDAKSRSPGDPTLGQLEERARATKSGDPLSSRHDCRHWLPESTERL